LNDDERLRVDAATPAWRRLRPFHAAAVLFFVCVVALHYDRTTGFTRFICFGDRFTSTRLPEITAAHPFVFRNNSGYDGQFYAQIAANPLLADPALGAALDSPAYRSRRIGLPWFAWLAGVGHTPWVLQAYALANVVAWLALAVLLLHWIPPVNATARLAWLGCLFGVGTTMSVERALTDVPAALLLATAIFLAERGRRLAAGGSFALALLTRDMSVLGGCLLLPANREDPRAWLRATLVGVAAITPFALWSFYVYLRFPGVPGADTSNFALPFSAMFGMIDATYHAVPQRGWAIFLVRMLSTCGLCAQCLSIVVSARRDWRERWWRVGAAFALLFAVLGPPVWEDYEAAARAVIPMTLAFNILLVRDRWWSFPLCLIGNLPLLHGVYYLLQPAWTSLQ
jgi:hypothetical protein